MWAGRGEESEELKQYNLQGQKVSWEGKIVSFFLFFFLFSFFFFFEERKRGSRETETNTERRKCTSKRMRRNSGT